MFSFRTACLVTGALFVTLPALVLLFTGASVQQYVHDPADWPFAIDAFRFVAALNLTVGALLLALRGAALDAGAALRVALAMVLGMAILAAVHVGVLSSQGEDAPGGLRWTRTLLIDTSVFALIALYWAGVALAAGRRTPQPERAAA